MDKHNVNELMQQEDSLYDELDYELDELAWCLKFHEDDRSPVKLEKEEYYNIVIDLYENILMEHRENKW